MRSIQLPGGNITKVFFYLMFIGAFALVIFFVLREGSVLEEGRKIMTVANGGSKWDQFVESLVHNFSHPLARLLAQIAVIIISARFFGFVFRKIGQPAVIGEIIAGIVLGPSLVGNYFPGFSAALFPPESLSNLSFLSQMGLILFMFVIGMELDLNVLRNKAHDAVVISHASIIAPFAFGIGLAYFIYEAHAPEGINFTSFGLFMGIAMSITAFPVLARIVQERGIQKTRVGTIAITCAAADDITAWCILAAVIAIVKAGSVTSALYIIAMAILYVVVMIKIVRPFLKRVGELHASHENLSKPVVGIFFLVLIFSAYITEVIGIHALFGAFMVGTIIPDNPRFRAVFIEKVEDVAIVLLLPLFFVFTGLRTEIGLLDSWDLWKITIAIIVVAVAGKFLGSALAAKFVGQSWKDSLSIGALMNTRGLMELVVLNIGFDLGVLTPEIFAMMVIMALVTTMMTGPGLNLINFLFGETKVPVENDLIGSLKFKILISFANPETGRSLVRLANSLTIRSSDSSSITVMHLTPVSELHLYDVDEYEQNSLLPVLEESRLLNQEITTLFKPSSDIERDIADTANKGQFDLLLIGIGHSIYQGTILGRILGFTTSIINPEKLLNKVTGRERLFKNSPFDERTLNILSNSDVPVGILLDKKTKSFEKVIVPIVNVDDVFVFAYVQKLIANAGAQVVICDVNGHIKNLPELRESIRAIEQHAPNHIALMREKSPSRELIAGQSLMVVSVEGWKELMEAKAEWLSDIPSTLILAQKH